MTLLCIALAGIALAWTFAYLGAPAWAWALAAGILDATLWSSGLRLAGALFAPVVLTLAFAALPALRRGLLTRSLFRGFKAVLPAMSDTEREALEAGDVWWEAEMFRGRPRWDTLMRFEYTALTPEEQSFLDNEVVTVCRMVDDWQTEFEDHDLPREVWAFLKEKRFFAMLIKKEFGGLGFSAYAQSCVVTRLATKSITLAVTVMVPNSLGPGELLMHYGTKEQQQQWLPRLVDGREVPCFGLTGPEVGSDATAMPDAGVVCHGEHDGKRTLGIRLNFSKRWITLAPVATVVGLAFKLSDPEGLLGDRGKSDYGITCALIPANHAGVEIGRRHYPGGAFMNGPIFGKDVFIPVDWIIGGPQMAGKGWRMLVECLSAGRGISLPALSTAAAQSAYRMTGAFGRIRRQFRTAIGQFEGVQEATGRIAGLTYTMEAMRRLTASAVDHCAPSVVTAMAKYHMTEMMRRILLDAMDVFAGRGVQMGPRNPLATAYRSIPIAITVEGANILTRNLMIFGQGAIRCHEFVFAEMQAAQNDDLVTFDRLLFKHIGFTVNRGARAFTLGLTGSALARAPRAGVTARYFRELTRLSAALAFTADVTMLGLGGELKRRERLSARLGDVLSQLYIGSAVLKFFLANGECEEEEPLLHWAMENVIAEITRAFEGFYANYPHRRAAGMMRAVCFPLGLRAKPVADAVNERVANQLMEKSELRDRLTSLVFIDGGRHDPIGRIEHAFELLQQAEVPYLRYAKLHARGELAGDTVVMRLNDAVTRNLLTRQEADLIKAYDEARYDAILTDDFDPAYLAGDHRRGGRAEIVDFAAMRGRVA